MEALCTRAEYQVGTPFASTYWDWKDGSVAKNASFSSRPDEPSSSPNIHVVHLTPAPGDPTRVIPSSVSPGDQYTQVQVPCLHL